MPAVFCQEVSRKQVERRAAGFAVEYLDPEEGFDGNVLVAIEGTESPIVAVHLGAKCGDEVFGSLLVARNVEVLDCLSDDPGRHRTDVVAIYIAADAVRLDQRSAAAHERICDPKAGEVVRPEERVLQAILAEFGEDQAAEQGAGTAGEPLVDADAGAVVLLDLLLSQRHQSDEGNVETPFDAHCGVIASDRVRFSWSVGEARAGPTEAVRSRVRSLSMARGTTHETETSSRLATSTREA